MKLSYGILIGISLIFSGNTPKQNEKPSRWISLFNGRDFTGWEKYLSYQPGSGDTTILGVNNDPENVFSVENGVIHISGKIWGALTTLDEYENFHLSFEFRWGEKRWPPRENTKRDSGVLFYCVVPHGAQDDHWMRSHEIQVQEGDCGDHWSLDGAMFDVETKEIILDGEKQLQYQSGGEMKGNNIQRIIKLETNENPRGEWNTMEVIAHNDGNITHIVNGKVVLKASNSMQTIDDKIVPLRKGKIQIQSEGAEVFYRNIKIKQL